MVIAWYMRSSDWRDGENGLDCAGRELDAELGEGCIVDLPFSAFGQSLKIDRGPVLLVLTSLDGVFSCKTTTKRRSCKQNSGPDLPIGPSHDVHLSINRTRKLRTFLR